MKKIFLLVALALPFSVVKAQLLKRMADRAKNKMEQKAGDKVDKTIDDATDGEKKDKKNNDDNSGEKKSNDEVAKKDESNSSSSSSGTSSSGSSAKSSTLKTYSKYDFIPGEKVIAFEDFSKTDVGDFPTRWNTNSTAEVVTVDSKEGKWLKLVKEGVFYPEFITDLPENFTLEFDLGANDEWYSSPFVLNITKLKKPESFADYGHYVRWQGDHTIHMDFKPFISDNKVEGNSKLQIAKEGNYEVNNEVQFNNWNNGNNKFAHISVWRQKQRMRVYLNGEKIWDIPKAFNATSTYNAITFAVQSSYRAQDFFILNNIRLAVGAPDTRNKLITEGKFVTHGILFDVNKDVVKPESYGTLKDIANVLKENADVKVKIIGHTDSDGDDKKNMELSQKRAEAVKNALSKEFGIEDARIQTDGKGESQPADKNDTAEGKANNRRVEFVKL
jgi:OOP family OmpA-OmpF porin